MTSDKCMEEKFTDYVFLCSYQLLFPDALKLLASCKCLLIAMVMA